MSNALFRAFAYLSIVFKRLLLVSCDVLFCYAKLAAEFVKLVVDHLLQFCLKYWRR